MIRGALPDFLILRKTYRISLDAAVSPFRVCAPQLEPLSDHVTYL
jgi:hypothetical protein